MSDTGGPILLTAPEVAAIVRVNKATIYRWAKAGRLPMITIGETIRFRRADVERLIAGDAA